MNTISKKPKPFYKIAGRFLLEFFRYSKTYHIPWKAFSEFPVYYNYNKILKSPAEIGLPWIAHGAFLYMENFLTPNMRILEFGCGGSTLYFAKKVGQVISIEDNHEWYTVMKERTNTFSGVELRHIPVDKEFISGEFASNMDELKHTHSYKTYALGASEVQNESIDVLVIDGRARIGCLRTNLSKVKRDGIVLFDNTDRTAYATGIQEILGEWDRFDFSGVTVSEYYFTQTSIFKRKTR
jgi:predicted O-methyltransferase YrrM